MQTVSNVIAPLCSAGCTTKKTSFSSVRCLYFKVRIYSIEFCLCHTHCALRILYSYFLFRFCCCCIPNHKNWGSTATPRNKQISNAEIKKRRILLKYQKALWCECVCGWTVPQQILIFPRLSPSVQKLCSHRMFYYNRPDIYSIILRWSQSTLKTQSSSNAAPVIKKI